LFSRCSGIHCLESVSFSYSCIFLLRGTLGGLPQLSGAPASRQPTVGPFGNDGPSGPSHTAVAPKKMVLAQETDKFKGLLIIR